jgi:hypothetical protein
MADAEVRPDDRPAAVGRDGHGRAARWCAHPTDENADLFWGVRGGGGNFGVVTEFEFNLNPLGPQVLAGPIFWLMEDSPKVLRFYRDWIAEAPDELMTIVIHARRRRSTSSRRSCTGSSWSRSSRATRAHRRGRARLKPLKELGVAVLDLCQPKPYLEHQSMFDPSYPARRWYYMRACDIGELTTR